MTTPERGLAQAMGQIMEDWEQLGQTLVRVKQSRMASASSSSSAARKAAPALLALDQSSSPLPGQGAAVVMPVSPVSMSPVSTAVEDRVQALRHLSEPQDQLEIDDDILPDLLAEYDSLHEGIGQALEAWQAGDVRMVPELRRQVHTMKGLLRMANALRLGDQLHALETDMENTEAGKPGRFSPLQVAQRYAAVHAGWQALLRPPMPEIQTEDGTAAPVPVIRVPSQVTIASELVDRLITETTESRLTASALEGNARDQREILRDLSRNSQALARLLRDLEVYAEAQIQSRRAQLAPGESFDPLEMDRYTVLQELSRSLIEAGTDAMDLQRDLGQRLGEQEHLLTYQGRALGEVQSGLHKTRLTPVAELHGRLQKVIANTALEVGKEVSFVLDSGNLDLDRVLLNRVVAPLEHILRNAVDHGLESGAARTAAGKSSSGNLMIRVRQEAGRVNFEVADDGAGLNVDRIRDKAIHKGMWAEDRAMSTQEAADMICQPGFSTAEALSQISGRGVGMDVVRSEVLGMGGRFRIVSTQGQGMTVTLELPTVVATASVLVVEAGGERWAVPVDLIEDVARQPIEALQEAARTGRWDDETTFAELANLMGLSPTQTNKRSSLVLWLRENTRRVMVQVDKIGEVAEVPLRPAGALWAGIEGVAGITVLPDGQAAFLIDPLRARRSGMADVAPVVRPRQPTVMVVDDSITVRKATVRFLEREGYLALTAKDGQEALEMLALGHQAPDVVLLDVEMPRMNGFECLKAIRQTPRHADLPVVMITSRTAAKHRQRAEDLGVQGYLGKPFPEEELSELLKKLVST